jgi:hypothetical protein
MELKQLFRLTQWLLLLGLLSFSRIEATSPEFDAEHAFQYLVRQCEFGPRNHGSNGHENAREYLISELKQYSKEVVAQEFKHKDKPKSVKLTNIIARFGKKGGRKFFCPRIGIRVHLRNMMSILKNEILLSLAQMTGLLGWQCCLKSLKF